MSRKVHSDSPKDNLTNQAHLLVVDDEQMLRDLLSDSLGRMGYRITTAANGEEAVACYRSQPGDFDLVFLDMTMPKLSGFDTLMQLQKVDPKVRVLVTSGYANSDELHATLRAGALGLVIKPYNMDTLARRIKQALTDG